MTRFPSTALRAWTLSAALLGASRAMAADDPAETAAMDAIDRAAGDYAAKEFATGGARLEAALRNCEVASCAPLTRALLLRDLGAMQLMNDDEKAAQASFAAALGLNATLGTNPRYDSPALRAAWKKAQRSAAETVVASGEQPTGDFKHTPAAAQKPQTPVPVYVQYSGGGEGHLARVVVRYRGAQSEEWSRLELRRAGAGWAGLVPCAAVTPGLMRYWVQGLDDGGDPIGQSGDAKHPYTVPINDTVTGEPPHLPDMPPPTCESAECPPGAEGCKGSPAVPPGGSPDRTTPSPGGGGPFQPFHGRLWVGLTATLDFVSLPSGTDLCKLDPDGRPANASAAYCTTPDGADFPSRASPAQSNALVPGKAGSLDGGLQAGNFRLMLSADYALFPWLLVGGRLGYTFNTYPGQWAVRDGRAAGSSLYIEGRATYVFGENPLAHEGLAPIAFLGTGLSEFDASGSRSVSSAGSVVNQSVNIWITDGPWFLALGGGVRYQLSVGAAFTGAVRLNTIVGGNGMMVTVGPELGAAYAF
jgi:hypothetical protein